MSESALEPIQIQIAEQQDKLVSLFQHGLQETMFTNRSELRPASLKAIARTEAEAVLAFCKNPDPKLAQKHGSQLCKDGLGSESVLGLAQITRQFAQEQFSGSQRASAVRLLEPYLEAVLQGYQQTREIEVLKEQEHLQSAFQRTISQYSNDINVTELAAELASAAAHALDPARRNVIQGQVRSQLVSLADLFHNKLRETVFSSRSFVRPAALPELAKIEAERVLDFLSNPDRERATHHGADLCQTGLSQESIESLAQTTRQFCLTQLPNNLRIPSANLTDIYFTAVMKGHRQSSGTIILNEQERIRKALEKALQHYAVQMETAADIAQATTSILNLDDLLKTSVDLIQQKFDLYYVGIFLLDEFSQWAVLRAGTGKPGEEMLRGGHKLKVGGNSMIGWCVHHSQPRIALDVGREAIRFVNPHLPDTHSEMALPLVARGAVIGAISIQSQRVGAFSTEDIRVLNTIAGQLAGGIENARLFAKNQSQIEEMRATQEQLAGKTWQQLPGQNNPAFLYELNLDQFYSAQDLWRPEMDEAYREHRPVVHPQSTTLPAQSAMAVPIMLRDQVIGTIDLYDIAGPREWTQDEVGLVTTISSQAALTLENARLFQEAQRKAIQLGTAAEIARDTSSTLALEALLNRSVSLIRDRYGYYHSSIFLIDESGINAVVRASTGRAGEEMKRRNHKLAVGSQSAIGYVTEAGNPLVINNVAQNPIHRPNPLLPDTRAELAIPMKIGNRIIGALDVQATEIGAFTPDDVAVLQSLGDQIAVAVDNAQSYELAQQAISETRQRVQEMSLLFTFTQKLASAPMDTYEIASIVTRNFIDVMDIPAASISVAQAETDELRTLIDMTRTEDGREVIIKEDEGLMYHLADYPATAKVMQTFQPLVISLRDPTADPAEIAYMRKNDLFTLLILPLAVKGQSFGIIELESWDRERLYTPEQINLAMTLANASAVSLENARLYQEQIETAEKLREVDKLKSQFLANMSHELRTPLNSIIGFSRVILKGIDGPITDLQQQDLTAINSSGQHLLNLINDVLDISKIEAGKMELAFEDNVSLGDLINSAMSTAVGLTKDKPIKLERIVPADLPTVRADPTRIRQVIINFLSNAAKFTEEGTITVKALLQRNARGIPEVMVGVTDTGIGITPEDQTKLFQAFTQVDASPTRKTGGTGLGLSISRRLIEMHGGRIGVHSEASKGSTFYFTIPVPGAGPDNADGENAKSILAIDDDRMVINLYERYLKEHGYHVVPLTDPAHAVEMARQIKPFAITLDIMMPNRNGWTVLEMLKADPVTRNIPVVICSIVEDQEKGFSLGAADYLTKPILEDDLVTALNRLNGDGSIHEVLVVDDDADDLRLVQKILQEHTQYTVRLAHGGPEGLAAIQAKPPHAVILDLFMPELDGFAFLEAIRADKAFRDIPVIIFTAGDLTDEQVQRLSDFSQTMIRKGLFKEEDLLASIEHALQRFKPPEVTK